MRRLAHMLVCATALIVLVPAAVAGAQQPRASLSGPVCQTAAEPLNRLIQVTATIRPITGTQRMALRFELLQRTPGGRFHQVKGGDLGRWLQHPAGNWAVIKQVVNLPAPAVYRFQVSFHWLGSSAAVISAETLRGPACDQPQ